MPRRLRVAHYLSSFVTTYCEPEARSLYEHHMYRNFADSDMYPHTKETEFQCVQLLHDLWNGPKDAEPYGAATIGSSEACMLAGLAHKWNRREARKKAGKDSTRPILEKRTVAGDQQLLILYIVNHSWFND